MVQFGRSFAQSQERRLVGGAAGEVGQRIAGEEEERQCAEDDCCCSIEHESL